MDNENNINMASDVLKDTQQASISDAKNCIEVKHKGDNVKSKLEKHGVIWTPRVISTLLKIYEAKLFMLKTPKITARIWIVISKCLKRYNIKVNPEQVRWVVKALTKRYKRCLNGEPPQQFKYFKQMDKIYAKFRVDQDPNTITEMTRNQNSLYNARLNCTGDRKISSRTVEEMNAIIELSKKRLADRIESDRLESKMVLENQWLQYIKNQDQKPSRVENFENNLKIRDQELELRKNTLKIHESAEYRKMQMWERKHETLLRIEKEKFEMLKKMSSLQK